MVLTEKSMKDCGEMMREQMTVSGNKYRSANTIREESFEVRSKET
jgi:hypothetical protein